MKFVSVRDLRNRSAEVWRDLDRERELVITSNGKPIAIVSATDEAHFEESLRELRQARALRAVKHLQEQSLATGRDKLSDRDIAHEIAAVRKGPSLKIVLDTNVLVSALLSPYRPPAQVLQLLLKDRVGICYDARILCEYREVLARPKFDFDPEQTEALIEFLERTGELIAPTPWPSTLPDPDDAMFLEVAAAGQADHLVTGNLKHFPVRIRRGVSVVTPTQFLELAELK